MLKGWARHFVNRCYLGQFGGPVGGRHLQFGGRFESRAGNIISYDSCQRYKLECILHRNSATFLSISILILLHTTYSVYIRSIRALTNHPTAFQKHKHKFPRLHPLSTLIMNNPYTPSLVSDVSRISKASQNTHCQFRVSL